MQAVNAAYGSKLDAQYFFQQADILLDQSPGRVRLGEQVQIFLVEKSAGLLEILGKPDVTEAVSPEQAAKDLANRRMEGAKFVEGYNVERVAETIDAKRADELKKNPRAADELGLSAEDVAAVLRRYAGREDVELMDALRRERAAVECGGFARVARLVGIEVERADIREDDAVSGICRLHRVVNTEPGHDDGALDEPVDVSAVHDLLPADGLPAFLRDMRGHFVEEPTLERVLGLVALLGVLHAQTERIDLRLNLPALLPLAFRGFVTAEVDPGAREKVVFSGVAPSGGFTGSIRTSRNR